MGLLARVKAYQKSINETALNDTAASGSGLLDKARRILSEKTHNVRGNDGLFEEIDFDEPETLPSESSRDVLSADDFTRELTPADEDLSNIVLPTGSYKENPSEIADAPSARDGKPAAADEGEPASFPAASAHMHNSNLPSRSADFTPQPVLILPQLMAGIGSIDRGIDAPYHAFGILADLLGLGSALLLLPEHADETLVPYCSKGFDTDSLIRLRVNPADSIESGLLRESAELEGWKHMFSSRDRSNIESLIVIPLGSTSDGLFIISGSKIASISQESIDLVVATLGNALGKMIRKSRGILLENISPLFILSSQEFPSQLRQAVDSPDSLLLGLPKAQVRSFIETTIPQVWSMSFYRDCLRVLGSIVQDDGSVYMDDDYFFILISGIQELDPSLIIEQLEFSFQQAFSAALPGLDFIQFSREEMQSLSNRLRDSRP